jgi:RimJ/RimL family protein N-acetyltransferase
MEALQLRDRDAEAFANIDKDADLESKSNQWGTAFTGFAEDGIIGCAGILPVWSGVGHAWVVMGKDYKSHRIWIHKNVKSFMNKVICGLDLRRVQANVVCDFDAGKEWLERMGFENEGRMKKYGPDGKDHYLYARIIE